MIQEKAQSEEDIVKLESKLQELVETLGNEAQKQHDNFQHTYGDIPPVYKPVFIVELFLCYYEIWSHRYIILP